MPRISQLPSLATADNADEIAIVDVSASTTKKITRGDLLKSPLPTNSVTTAAVADNAITGAKIAPNTITADKVDFATGIWWEEVGRATLGTSATSLSVTGLPKRRRYKVLITATTAVSESGFFVVRFNNDSRSTAYFQRAVRSSGTAVSAIGSSSNAIVGADTNSHGQHLIMELVVKNGETDSEYKTAVVNGGTNIDSRSGMGIWTASSDINSINLVHSITNGIGAGSTIIVLGND